MQVSNVPDEQRRRVAPGLLQAQGGSQPLGPGPRPLHVAHRRNASRTNLRTNLSNRNGRDASAVDSNGPDQSHVGRAFEFDQHSELPDLDVHNDGVRYIET